MFKLYKQMLKSLRALQNQMWLDSTASFPAVDLSPQLNTRQIQTLRNMSDWAEKAVSQSLELQQEWLGQWSGRADSKKLKPKSFAGLSAEARDSMQRWLDNQNQLRDQWLEIMKSSAGPDALPDLDTWDKAIRASVQDQTDLLREWSELTSVKKLSPKELEKLSDQIVKSMQNSIATQERLWSHWLRDLTNLSATAQATKGEPAKKAQSKTKPQPKAKAKPQPKAKAAPKPQPKAKAPPKPQATAKKEPETKQPPAADAPKKAEKPESKSADNLKRISGIGPALEKKLNNEGISTFAQLAKLTDAEIAHLEKTIIRFPGRIEREKWVEQAKELATKS